jgi:hypothetical protein
VSAMSSFRQDRRLWPGCEDHESQLGSWWAGDDSSGRGSWPDCEQQAEGVGDAEPLAAVDLLPSIAAGIASDGLKSINPAHRSGLRPSWLRSCSRATGRSSRWLWPAPSARRASTRVCQGGKSAGGCRHAHPVRTTYKIVFTSSRECFSGGHRCGPAGAAVGSVWSVPGTSCPERSMGGCS